MKNKLSICTLVQRRFIIAGFAHLFICISATAQTASPDVIASAGDYYASASGSVSWTIGEPVSDTYYSSSNILTKGFHQPLSVSLASIEDNNSSEEFYAYPNPVIDQLMLDFSKLSLGEYNIQIFDATGQVVRKLNVDHTVASQQTVVNMSDESAGMYLIKIAKVSSQKQIVFRMIKQ